eukprot:gnl/MRDRNA2_/MRDRNA2_27565_c0_seq1.p1 gnl/MRDRNA2_/MRDRNA2_27565_c0~~gnl/MRDRNA2_/MRDRNA2_27565_c0_seq1.p1  ORF type:complete len:1306 (-),score=248.22 gnl/MRDRNA2_/MRDRNA2_27565_c0_seq1:133-4050(-)
MHSSSRPNDFVRRRSHDVDDDTPKPKMVVGNLGHSDVSKGPNAKKLWLTAQDRDEVLEEQLDENEQLIVVRHFLGIAVADRKEAEVRTLVSYFQQNPFFIDAEFSNEQLINIFISATLQKYRKGRAIPFQPGKGIVVLEGMIYGHRKEAIVRAPEKKAKSNQNQSTKKAKALSRASTEGIQNMDQFLTDLVEEVPDEAVIDDVGRATDWLDDVMKLAANRRSNQVRLRGDASEHVDGDAIVLEPHMRLIEPSPFAIKDITSVQDCLLFDPRISEGGASPRIPEWCCYVAQTYTQILEFTLPEPEPGQVIDLSQNVAKRGGVGQLFPWKREAVGNMGNAIATLLAQELLNPSANPLQSLLAMVVGPDLTVTLLELPEKEGQQVALSLKPMVIAKGSTVMEQGEKLKNAFFIRTGEVRVRVRLAQGTNTKTLDFGTVSGDIDEGVPPWIGAMSCREGRPETFGYSVVPTKDVEGLAIPAAVLRELAPKLPSSFWYQVAEREKAWSTKIADETAGKHHAPPGCGYRYIIPPDERKACMVDLGHCPTWIPPPFTAAGRKEEKRRREKLEHRSRVKRAVGLEGVAVDVSELPLVALDGCSATGSAAGDADALDAPQDDKAEEPNASNPMTMGLLGIFKKTKESPHSTDPHAESPKTIELLQNNDTQGANSNRSAAGTHTVEEMGPVELEGSRPSTARQQQESTTSSEDSKPTTNLQIPKISTGLSDIRGIADRISRTDSPLADRFKTNDSVASPTASPRSPRPAGLAGAFGVNNLLSGAAMEPGRYANLYASLANVDIFDPSLGTSREDGMFNIAMLKTPLLFGEGTNDAEDDAGTQSLFALHSPREWGIPEVGPAMSLPAAGAKQKLKRFTKSMVAASRLTKQSEDRPSKTVTTPAESEKSEVSPTSREAKGHAESSDTLKKAVDDGGESSVTKKNLLKARLQKGIKKIVTANLHMKGQEGELDDRRMLLHSRDRDLRWQERQVALGEAIEQSPVMNLAKKTEAELPIKVMSPEKKDNTVRRMKDLHDQARRKSLTKTDDAINDALRIEADSPLIIQHLGTEDHATAYISDHRGVMPSSAQVVRTFEQATMGFRRSPKVKAQRPMEAKLSPSLLRQNAEAPMRPSTAPRHNGKSKTSRPTSAGSSITKQQCSRPNTARSSPSTSQAHKMMDEQPGISGAFGTSVHIRALLKPQAKQFFKAGDTVFEDSAQESVSPTSLSSAIAKLTHRHTITMPKACATAESPRVGQGFASDSQFEDQESVIYADETGHHTPTSDHSRSWSTLPGVSGFKRVIRPAQSRPPSASLKPGS